jgi:hypothetical protein
VSVHATAVGGEALPGEPLVGGLRDGILRHQFNERLESFALCYSQSLLLADFKENNTLHGLKILTKKSAKLDSIHD